MIDQDAFDAVLTPVKMHVLARRFPGVMMLIT